MSSTNPIRVLNDSPLSGPINMARDEALMTRVGLGQSQPTLRLYQWDPPTISLGYFQPYSDYEALESPAGDLAVVRRQTGGGAILHDLELTYSLALPVSHPLLGDGASHLYEHAHDAVIACMRELDIAGEYCGTTDDSGPAKGPFFCFERRHRFDVVLESGKITGSAQRRTRDAVLQHGSIILGGRFDQQRVGRVSVAFDTTIVRLRPLFVATLAALCDLQFENGEWTPEERDAANELIPKYAGDEWTKRT